MRSPVVLWDDRASAVYDEYQHWLRDNNGGGFSGIESIRKTRSIADRVFWLWSYSSSLRSFAMMTANSERLIA